VYYIWSPVISWYPVSPRETGREIEKWRSADSGRRGGGGMRKGRVSKLGKE